MTDKERDRIRNLLTPVLLFLDDLQRTRVTLPASFEDYVDPEGLDDSHEAVSEIVRFIRKTSS